MEKKNLILKIIFSLLFVVLSLGLFYGSFKLNFLDIGFYGQNKIALADEEEEEEDTYEDLKCGKEIPVGEAMEKTYQLLEDIVYQLERIQGGANLQLALAEQMLELTEECNTDECDPVSCWETVEESCECCKICCPIPNGSPIPNGVPSCFQNTNDCIEAERDGVGEPRCPTNTWEEAGYRCGYTYLTNCDAVTVCNPPEPCISPWYYEGEYRACPQEEIQEKFERIVFAYARVASARQELFSLIDGKTEDLCDKLNEDIRWQEIIGVKLPCCCLSVCPIGTRCPSLTKIEIIRRKIYLSREEFDKCLLTPKDWDKIEEREMIGKFLFNCPLVVRENFAHYTKTLEEINGEEIPVCTSPHNWFCCSDSP